MKNLIVILLTIIIFGSCTIEKQDPVNCNLYIRYEEEGKKIWAEADFEIADGGNMASYTPKGGVAFMASNMTLQNLPNGKNRYTYKYEGALPKDLSLTWNKPDGGQTTFSTPAKSIDGFDFFKEGDHYVLAFKSGTFEKEDKLVLLFTDSNNLKLNLEKQGPTNDNKITISENELSSLSSGEAKLSIVLSRTTRTKQEDFDALTTFSYYSTERLIRF